MDYKVNMYYKNDGTRVSAHTRGKKVRRHRRNKGLGIGRKIVIAGCITLFVGIWYMCWSNNQTIETPKVEASNRDVTARERDFESTDIPAYTDLYDKYFKDKAPEARKIAICESGNRDIKSKQNKNGTYDYGRMQVNSLWLEVYNLRPSDLMQEEVNIATAKQIYDRTNNFNAWSSSRKCWL